MLTHDNKPLLTPTADFANQLRADPVFLATERQLSDRIHQIDTMLRERKATLKTFPDTLTAILIKQDPYYRRGPRDGKSPITANLFFDSGDQKAYHLVVDILTAPTGDTADKIQLMAHLRLDNGSEFSVNQVSVSQFTPDADEEGENHLILTNKDGVQGWFHACRAASYLAENLLAPSPTNLLETVFEWVQMLAEKRALSEQLYGERQLYSSRCIKAWRSQYCHASLSCLTDLWQSDDLTTTLRLLSASGHISDTPAPQRVGCNTHYYSIGVRLKDGQRELFDLREVSYDSLFNRHLNAVNLALQQGNAVAQATVDYFSSLLILPGVCHKNSFPRGITLIDMRAQSS